MRRRTGAITPVFGKAAAQAVASGQCEKGIVICTTGIGISISANKVKGHPLRPVRGYPVRRDVPPPQQCQHAGYGGGYRGPQPGGADGGLFLSTEFDGGRHTKRVELMMEIEG